MSDIKFSGRPKCDTPGCDLVSNFHGMGHDWCWGCYSRNIISWTKQPVSSIIEIDCQGSQQLELNLTA